MVTSLHVRVPDSLAWILDSTLSIPDSRYWIPDFCQWKFGFLIPIVNGIPDSLNCIPDFPKPKIPDSTSKNSRNPESRFPYIGRVTWSDIRPNLKTAITELLTLHFFTLINRSLVTL